MNIKKNSLKRLLSLLLIAASIAGFVPAHAAASEQAVPPSDSFSYKEST